MRIQLARSPHRLGCLHRLSGMWRCVATRTASTNRTIHCTRFRHVCVFPLGTLPNTPLVRVRRSKRRTVPAACKPQKTNQTGSGQSRSLTAPPQRPTEHRSPQLDGTCDVGDSRLRHIHHLHGGVDHCQQSTRHPFVCVVVGTRTAWSAHRHWLALALWGKPSRYSARHADAPPVSVLCGRLWDCDP